MGSLQVKERAKMDVGCAFRVNAACLPQYAGQRVALVGKVVNVDSGMATLQCSDGQNVQVTMNAGSTYGEFVEVVGIANADGSQSVREERACDMGNNFNLDNYEQLVQLANGKYKHLFQ